MILLIHNVRVLESFLFLNLITSLKDEECLLFSLQNIHTLICLFLEMFMHSDIAVLFIYGCSWDIFLISFYHDVGFSPPGPVAFRLHSRVRSHLVFGSSNLAEPLSGFPKKRALQMSEMQGR